jgi:hypothetical protein
VPRDPVEVALFIAAPPFILPPALLAQELHRQRTRIQDGNYLWILAPSLPRGRALVLPIVFHEETKALRASDKGIEQRYLAQTPPQEMTDYCMPRFVIGIADLVVI